MKATEIHVGRAAICREVLDDLPQWFAIPEAKEAYVAAAADLPMFACHGGDEPTGFLSLKVHTPFAAEIFVLGVKRRLHRRGVGRALVGAAARFAGEQRLRFLTVKTLAASHPDPHYAATRRFYEAVGFLALEVFPTLWGPANPCLMMIKPLQGRPGGAGRVT